MSKSSRFSNLACRLERNLKEMTTSDPDIRKHALVKIHFIEGGYKNHTNTYLEYAYATHSSLLTSDIAQCYRCFNKPSLLNIRKYLLSTSFSSTTIAQRAENRRVRKFRGDQANCDRSSWSNSAPDRRRVSGAMRRRVAAPLMRDRGE